MSDPLVGRLVDGRYQVVSRIARGGMATVYLAVDRRLDREVALKVMHPHLAEGTNGMAFVARFRREARAAARLTHPGLVGVFDQGVDGDTSYLTMEYVDGTTLRRRLGELGSLTLGEALAVLEQVLDALAAAHRTGLVHRDIKPENVLLATDGRIKVTDFGLARAVTEVTATTTGTVLGTVAYLGPELVSRGVCDPRTDVYAAGILLYEMVTGRQPFTGESAIHVAFQHVNSDIPAPSALVPWLPREVDELVGALAARDPDDRPADAGSALALVRRSRGAVDPATLSRRADVAPTTAAPAGSGDLGTPGAALAGPGPDDDRHPGTGATDRLDLAPRGTTVALPIGVGSRAGGGATGTGSDDGARVRRRRRRRLVLLLLLLGLAGGGGAWWYLTVGAGAYTTVPDVIGESEDAAADHLGAAGLGVTSERVFDEEPPGTVVASDPGPRASIRKDGEVALHVSKGPEMTRVPEGLVGASAPDARAALTAAGLDVGPAQTPYDDAAPAGTVMAASAEPGAEVPRGTEVVLTVSQGPAPVTIPQVIGATQEQATQDLQAEGLVVEAGTAFSDTVPAGSVISQQPAQGSLGHRRDTVTIVVSRGPELIEVPRVVSQQYDAAAGALEDLGFVPRRNDVLGGFFGTVRDQSVAAGERVPRGTVITLTVV